MKRMLCFVVAVMMLLSIFMPVLSATTDVDVVEQSPWYESLKRNSIQYSCTYNEKNSTVTLSGTVSHDTMIRCKDYQIEVYRVLPGESLISILSAKEKEPVASADISMKFSFTLPTHTATERFSGYAVVLKDEDGKLYLSGNEEYTQIPAYTPREGDKLSQYKGISVSDVSVGGSLGAGSAIIPIYIDQLLSKNSAGYLYPVDQGYLYFDKAYVDRLDSMVRSYSVTGCQVYLQFLLSESGMDLAMVDTPIPEAQYYMPNVYSHEILLKLSAVATFLVSRYDQEQSGLMSGIVLGSQIDQREYNYHGYEEGTAEYARAYAFYLLIIGASARELRTDIEILLPFSDRNDYLAPSDAREGTSAELLEDILSTISDMGTEGFSCMTLIESRQTPLGIDGDFIDPEAEWMPHLDASRLEPDFLHQYEEYLGDLANRNTNAPYGYMYVWTPNEELSGIPLACAYAYGYYASLREGGPVSFVLSTQNDGQLAELCGIIQRINTKDSVAATEALLPYFQAENWDALISDFEKKTLDHEAYFRCELLSATSRDFKGSFSFLDFSTGNISEWFSGVNCSNVRSGYGDEGKRGVYAQMNTDPEHKYGELICKFEYPESMAFTPYLEFVIEMTDSALHNESLYEIVVTIGDTTGSASVSKIVRAGESSSIMMDIQQYSEDHLVEYLKFSVRKIRGDAEEFRLWMFEMNGCTSEYTSSELTELIAMERAKIRNQFHEDAENEENMLLTWMALGVLIVFTVIGVLVVTRFRQTDRNSKDDGPIDQNG